MPKCPQQQIALQISSKICHRNQNTVFVDLTNLHVGISFYIFFTSKFCNIEFIHPVVSELDDGRVTSKKILELCKQKLKNIFRKKILRKRFPILDWLPKQKYFCGADSVFENENSFFFFLRYTSADAAGDIVAGITVGLTIIPQALAYSGIAGLDPEVSQFIFEQL